MPNTHPNKSGNGNPDYQLATLMKSAVTVNQTITDNRQGSESGNSSVRVATVDIGVITDGLKSSTYNKVDLSSNPVIYIADLSADPADATTQRGDSPEKRFYSSRRRTDDS